MRINLGAGLELGIPMWLTLVSRDHLVLLLQLAQRFLYR